MSNEGKACTTRLRHGARARLMWTAFASLGALCAAPGFIAPALAQERARHFDIPEQSLAEALIAFADQAQVELFLPHAIVEGASGQAVRGVHTPEAALALLLSQSGYEGRLSAGVVVVGPASQARRRSVLPRSARAPILEDEIVVVGATARSEYTRAQAVDVYDADAIAATGAARTETFVAALTQNLNTRTQFAPGALAYANSQAVNGIDLRGLGVGASLVLYNGRRLPLGSEGRTVDLSLIPLDTIGRVEVLSDGASGLNGADAIGGVVNFVVRDDLDGGEARLDLGAVTEGGLREGGFAVSLGHVGARAHGLASLSGRAASALDRSDRDFARGAGRGDLSPEDERVALTLSGESDVGDRWLLRGDLLWGGRDVKSQFEFTDRGALVMARGDAQSAFINLGADYQIDADSVARLDITHSRRRDASVQDIETAEASTRFALTTEYVATDITAALQGRLGDFITHPVRYKVGVGGFEEHYRSAANTRRFARTTGYTFGEAIAPLIEPRDHNSLAQRLEVSVAARALVFDEASRPPLDLDLGDTFSPKLGVYWALNDRVSLRAILSRADRAPALSQLDPSANSAALTRAQLASGDKEVLAAFGVQPRLNPERAHTAALGFDVVSGALGWSFGATFFSTIYEGRLATPDPSNGLGAFARPGDFPGILVENPDASLIEEILRATPNTFNALGVDLSDLSAAAAALATRPGFVVYDNRARNLTRSELSGVDFNMHRRAQHVWGEVALSAQLSYIADYTEQVSPGAPVVRAFDFVYRPIGLRARAFASLQRRAWAASLAANFSDAYENPYGERSSHVSPSVTWDAGLRWDVGQNKDNRPARATISLAVRNIFNAAPPFVDSTGVTGAPISTSIGFDPANSDPVGRFVSLEIVGRW